MKFFIYSLLLFPLLTFAQEVQIGDLTHGGIVFYVDETGQHGLIAALEDLIGSYEWGCAGVDVVSSGADPQAIGSGLQNTLDIVAGCSEATIAASEALAYESTGFTDWYLPSKDELMEMYNVIENGHLQVNTLAFSNGWHWTSSELSNYGAWGVSFDGGYTLNLYKNIPGRVRVIRAF